MMHNRKKQDSLFVNQISNTNEINAVSEKPAGNANEDPFCVYAHKRHAVGSKIENRHGSESVCKEDGIWRNPRKK